ncbi:MAG: DUF2752 domain-containing protein [Thermoanaerobaculia bacterium]
MADDDPDRKLAFLWLAAAAGLVLLSPAAPWIASGLWGCPFKGLTGFACPLCGTTRAAVALAKLDPVGAFAHYPLPTLAWILFLVGGLVVGWLAWRRRPLPRLGIMPAWLKAGLVAAVLLNWAYSIATGV